MTQAKSLVKKVGGTFDDKEFTSIREIIQSITHGPANNETMLLLHQLGESNRFPRQWIQQTEYALKTGYWSAISEGFIKKEFIGRDGYFLIIAPHKLSYEKGGIVKLSVFFGKVLAVDSISIERIEQQALNVFGKLLEPILKLIPCICLDSCSRFGAEDSEAFIVPDSWDIPGCVEGPVINNLTQHRKRFHGSVSQNIPRIFEPKTAKLLLDSMTDENIGLQRQHIEYQYHDAGHATGLGLKHTIKNNLLTNYWYGAICEWRADSVGFELALRTLSLEEVGMLVATNFCLRFGVDAQRWGGSDFDTHSTSCLITLEYLLRSSEMYIKQGQLALRNPSYQDLAKAINMQATEAVYLTKQELCLKHPTGFFSLYNSINVHRSTKEIFQEFVVSPCQRETEKT